MDSEYMKLYHEWQEVTLANCPHKINKHRGISWCELTGNGCGHSQCPINSEENREEVRRIVTIIR